MITLLVLAAAATQVSTASTATIAARPEATFETAMPDIGPSTSLSFDRRMEAAGSSFGVYTRISSVIPSAQNFGIVSNIGGLVRFEIGAEYAPVSPVDGLALELGVAAGAQGRRTYQVTTALLGLTSIQASAVYRVPVWSYFGAYGRATASVNWGHLSFTDSPGTTEVDDVAVGFSGAAVLGTELAVPVGYTKVDSGEFADQWLSFHFEVGYAKHSTLNFDDLKRDTSDDTDPPRIARTSTDGGTFDLSGIVWRIGAAFRF